MGIAHPTQLAPALDLLALEVPVSWRNACESNALGVGQARGLRIPRKTHVGLRRSARLTPTARVPRSPQLAPGRIEAYVATDLRSASSSETLGLNKAAVTALLGLVVAPK